MKSQPASRWDSKEKNLQAQDTMDLREEGLKIIKMEWEGPAPQVRAGASQDSPNPTNRADLAHKATL